MLRFKLVDVAYSFYSRILFSDYHRVAGAIVFLAFVTLVKAGVQKKRLVFLDPRLREDDFEKFPEIRW